MLRSVAQAIRRRRLYKLVVDLLSRFEHTGHLGDLDEAVALGRRLLDSTPPGHPGLPGMLSNVGVALRTRFDHTGNVDDLEQGVGASAKALAIAPAGHPHVAAMLSNHANALQSRFELAGNVTDLDEAITVIRRAVGLTPAQHPDRAAYLSNLCDVLRARFKHTGDVTDLNEAIAFGRQAMTATLPGDFEAMVYVSRLGGALLARFRSAGDLTDLSAAIALSQQAAELTLPQHPERAARLSNLGTALLDRYLWSGNLSDLDDVVTLSRQATQATAHNHTYSGEMLSTLAGALRTRFRHTGNLPDLDEALTVARRALQTAPSGHPNRAARLVNMAALLQDRFSRFHNASDLDEAVDLCRQALQAISSGHPGLGDMLTHLCGALLSRFEDVGNLSDLDEAVTAGQRAAEVTPVGHPRQAAILSNLGIALRTKFELTGDPADLDLAATYCRQAMSAAIAGHTEMADLLSNLAGILWIRFELSGDADDLNEAANAWARASAAVAAPASARLVAARRWAETTARIHGLPAALPMYAAAINILPLLAWRGIDSADQQHQLHTDAAGLARDAAACAIAAGDPHQAIQWLEQGRGVLWSQLLDTRTDLSALEIAHPVLAEDLAACRAVLDKPWSADALLGTGQQPGTERTADTRLHAARSFDSLVAQVRALPASDQLPHPEAFLQPPLWSTMLPDDEHGPIVIVNIGLWRCDALVLTARDVTIVELPGLTEGAVVDTANLYLSALQTYQSQADRALLELAITSTLEWLWDNIAAPILIKLRYIQAPAETGPRLWWCPTGALTVLPLHGAGYHTRRTGDTVYDKVISSYTPTLRGLAQRRRVTASVAKQHMLIIALPDTPSSETQTYRPLPGSIVEMDLLTNLFSPNDTTILTGADANRDQIVAHLRRPNWLHASCHATQDLTDPAMGGLVPYDWRTAGRIGITEMSSPEHTGGEFAFLSACMTAIGGVTNLDEPISIAAAMHYAGWQHVIATLWNVWDDTAATLAASVYPHLVHQGIPDPSRSAIVLHNAIRGLRDAHPGHPTIWAPFIHIGR